MSRASPRRPTPLERRREPQQARARATLERFLDATAELLAELGFEAITTNAIAQRAGVNVSSLYKYFPNKYAVFAALSERTERRRLALLENAMTETDAGADWRVLTGIAIEALVLQLRTEPGAMELDRAIQAAPELRELNGRTNRRLVKRLVSLLRSSGREKISEERLEAVALVVVHASAALAQLAADPPIPSERIVPEWKLLLVSYLENYRD